MSDYIANFSKQALNMILIFSNNRFVAKETAIKTVQQLWNPISFLSSYSKKQLQERLKLLEATKTNNITKLISTPNKNCVVPEESIYFIKKFCDGRRRIFSDTIKERDRYLMQELVSWVVKSWCLHVPDETEYIWSSFEKRG